MAQLVVRPLAPTDHSQVEDIFWETSGRSQFATPAERAQFLSQYLTSYFTQLALVAVRDERVLGYIIATANTLAMRPDWAPHMASFEDLYERYPAHLHINCRAEARGLGVGSQLVAALENVLKERGVIGLHLITSATARNVSFYLRNGFSHRVERLWNERPLLLLGKTL